MAYPFPSDVSLVLRWRMTFGCRDKLTIAPYGFEKTTWDPSTDHFLPENFNAENMNGKAVCKVALLQRLGLSEHSSIILVSGQVDLKL
jgi:glycogen synthase